MNIYIPSRSRQDNVLTVESIPDNWLDRTAIVVPAEQMQDYVDNYRSKCRIIGVDVEGIHAVRQWICDHEDDVALMMDDDMVFYQRPTMAQPKLKQCSPAQMNRMLSTVEKDAAKFWAVAISAKQGNNHQTRTLVDVGRMNNVYAINTKLLNKVGARFDRLRVMEDFDVTLRMLRAGYPNRVYYKWAWNQLGSGRSGGCSDYRTGEIQADAAYELASLHSGFVKVVQKESKSGWNGMKVRTDVRIQWKKAYQESQK